MAMEVKLVVGHGKHAGREIPIPIPKFFVGRAEDCHLRVHSELVSRHHCVFMIEEGFVAVRDFQSKNGTFVNGKRIAPEVELKSGDRVQVGPMELEVRIGPVVAGKTTSTGSVGQETLAATRSQPSEDGFLLEDRRDDAGDDASNADDTVTMFPADLTTTPEKAGAHAPAPVESGKEERKGT